jgi:hypothetical protein
MNPDRGGVRPARAQDLRLGVEAEENVLIDVEGHQRLALNDTALALWDLCDGSHTVDEMVAAIVELFHADADNVRRDVDRAIEHLHQVGAVQYDSA